MEGPLIQVRYDRQAVEAIEKSLAAIPNALRRIAPSALNRTTSWTRVRVKRQLAAELAWKQAKANALMVIDRATATKLNSQLQVANRVIPVGQFASQAAGGVTAIFPSGQSRSYLHAFMATMPGGHTGGFLRYRWAKRGSYEKNGLGRIRREWRTSPTTGRRYKTELPIYEVRERAHVVLDLEFLKPLAAQGLARLDVELADRIKALVLGKMKSRRGRQAA
jgi:hypothetical protein